MGLLRGPHTLEWGDNVVEDVEGIDYTVEQDSEEYDTLGGRKYEVDGSWKAKAVITLLASDIPALAALLPQYYVANGDVLSTGETVNHAYGAMDFVPLACDASTVYNHFDLITCGNPGRVLRIVNARTKFGGYDIDNKVVKVKVEVIGEPASGNAYVQEFVEGSVAVVS